MRPYLPHLSPIRATLSDIPSARIWIGLWACALAAAWLLPNHYLPWSAFHLEAWAAFVCGIAMLGSIFLSRAPVSWPKLGLLAALLLAIPPLQFAFGMIPFAGQAWTTAAYLFGLLLAVLCGMRWESERPGMLQAAMLWAIGAAAILSVGLQLHQWLHLNRLELLSMGYTGGRPYANVGQPNQLGTLLLLGLLACAWAFHNGRIRAAPAILMAAFLLFGVALTQSRTAWLGLMLILAATWILRARWSTRRLPWIATMLGLWFVLSNLGIGWAYEALQLGGFENRQLGGTTIDLRLQAWRVFIDAALQRPWLGYGWTLVGHAQLAVALEHPSLGSLFQASHNLLIDLVLWCGIPIALLVTVSAAWWLISKMRAARNMDDMLLLMFIAILGNHAMLEFPLHYAYFLLPLGFVMGILEARLPAGGPLLTMPRWMLFALWMPAALLFFLLVRDYMRVEDNYYALRFERARIGTLPPRQPPEVLLLTQLREQIRLERFELVKGLDIEQLDWIRKVVSTRPDALGLYRLATALALNGRADEARTELRKVCKTISQHRCELGQKEWEQRSRENRDLAAVKWAD